MSIKRIASETMYQKALESLARGALELEEDPHPLEPPEIREEMIRKYNELTEMIEHYKVRFYAKEHPEMRPLYEQLGLIAPDEKL